MSKETSLRRRGFVKLCAGAAATVGASPRLLAATAATLHRYQRVRLVDATRRALHPGSLEVGRSYVFNYPYVTTPCFLLDLGREAGPGAALRTEDGRGYRWAGGIGPQRSLVAFCAICAHKMSHPSRSVSFIDYRHGEVSFEDRERHHERRAQVIFCCSERSVYDPLDGARVLGGPAPQPLATIVLEQREDGAIEAVGVLGGELYARFFDAFGFRLALEYGTSEIRRRTEGDAEVVPLEEYSRHPVHC